MSIEKKIICCDIDGTLLEGAPHFLGAGKLTSVIWNLLEKVGLDTWLMSMEKPREWLVEVINALYQEGYEIQIATGRPVKDELFTRRQLKKAGVQYHTLLMRRPFESIMDLKRRAMRDVSYVLEDQQEIIDLLKSYMMFSPALYSKEMIENRFLKCPEDREKIEGLVKKGRKD